MCFYCVLREGENFCCQQKSSYLSSVNENGGNDEGENDPCTSWKPGCHIWNMKVIYSQCCNGRWKCYECKPSSLLLCAFVKGDLCPSGEASRRATFVCFPSHRLVHTNFYTCYMCCFPIWIMLPFTLCPSVHVCAALALRNERLMPNKWLTDFSILYTTQHLAVLQMLE